MAITAYDLKQETLEDISNSQSLHYNFKGAKELGVLTTLTTLQLLNLSFNALHSLQALQQLQMLQTLNISHNQLASLQPISALSGLTTLNAGCNKVQDTSALQGLPVLRVLALHSNDIRKPSAVLLLTALPSLEYLTLAGNPVCNQENWQPATIAAMARLQVLDSLAITAADKSAAQPHASDWKQAVEAGDMVHSADSRGTGEGTTQSVSDSTGSSAGGKKSNHAGCLNAPASGTAGRLTPAAGIKDAAAMLPSISVPSMKPSTLVRKQDQQQAENVYGWSKSGQVTVVHRQRYAGNDTGPAAVDVRGDGSAAVQWPDGAMAASLDTETGMNAAYRVLAMYRSVVGVAASFDSNGGFVQYPDGSIMLVWNKKDGIGTCYAPDGSITHSFNSRKKAVGLKQDVRQQLDQHYSIVFKAKTYELQLFISCEGCELGLSLLHGAMLSRDAAAGKGAASAAAPVGKGTGPDAVAADDKQAMLARARALMAADFGITSTDEPSDIGPADSGAASRSSVSHPLATPKQPQDEMQAVLTRARALMAAADTNAAAPLKSADQSFAPKLGGPAVATVQAADGSPEAVSDAAGRKHTDEDDGDQALLARARALMAANAPQTL